MQKLVIVLIVLMSNSSWGLDSAYSRLREDYKNSQLPTFEQLKFGKTWYCSGSIEAAKRLFRYVPLWEPYFDFSINEFQQLVNRGPMSIGHVASLDLELQTVSENEFLRIDDENNLLIEVTDTFISLYGYYMAYLPSISFPSREAIMYLICENPDTHDDPDWHRGGYWSTPNEP